MSASWNVCLSLWFYWEGFLISKLLVGLHLLKQECYTAQNLNCEITHCTRHPIERNRTSNFTVVQRLSARTTWLEHSRH